MSTKQDELERLRRQNHALREALESLKHADGCYCEAAFSMCDGSHPQHSPECEKARVALRPDANNLPD